MVPGTRGHAVTADAGVTINFGQPTGGDNGVTAYPAGVKYGGTFYAGAGENVAMTLSYRVPDDAYFLGYTAGAGVLTRADGLWTLTMPDADVIISALFTAAFDTPDFALPAALTAIEDEAFAGVSASVMEIPVHCTAIGDRAFKDCPNLTQISVPKDCSLGADVFEGCELVYVFGAADSSAEAYCLSHDNCVFVNNNE